MLCLADKHQVVYWVGSSSCSFSNMAGTRHDYNRYLSIYLSISFALHLTCYLSIFLPTLFAIFKCTICSHYRYIDLFPSQSIYLSIYLICSPFNLLSIYLSIYLSSYQPYSLPDIGLAVRVFANGPGDLGSIPGRVIPKTQEMVLDASLLNTQHYKVRIKGKVEPSREGVAPFPTSWCSSYRKGSLRVTLDYGRQLYFYLSISIALHLTCYLSIYLPTNLIR